MSAITTTARKTGLEALGLTQPGNIHWNPSAPALVEAALQRGEAQMTNKGALLAVTKPRTGRSPNDKFIVEEAGSKSQIDWGKINRPMPPEKFDALLKKAMAYLNGKELFVCDAWAGADPAYRMPVRIITQFAWHSLFARQLFRRPTAEELSSMEPGFTVIDAADFKADPATDGTNSETVIAVSLERKIVLIGGTRYAGEIKKSIFTVLNHILPDRGVFPMHCSANISSDREVALFFGLSGTGKTTLSADESRHLIGDDEHGWSDRGIFNFEGGCYAKCIHLSPKGEPQIYGALRFGTVLENVVIDPVTRVPDFDSEAITENTRAAYPVEFIDNAVLEGKADGHPKAVVFLTCDAFGVLPPISRLTVPQAMYHFLSGYTAKLAGTEAGVTEPQAVFSTCYGAPFFTRPPMVYANLLAERVKNHNARCYLINTGWVGGPVGVGQRIKLAYTRAMVNAALTDQIKVSDCTADPIFGILVPKNCPDVPSEVLNARSSWKDASAYDAKAHDVAQRFAENFKKFKDVSSEVVQAGPRVN